MAAGHISLQPRPSDFAAAVRRIPGKILRLPGVMCMVDYMELFALCSAIADMGLLIVGIITLMIAISTIKKK